MDEGGTGTPGDIQSREDLGNPGLMVVPIGGRALRLLLLHELHHRREATVAELVRAVEGYPTLDDARLSKLVSDALRWEVRAGRVSRPSRGRYRFVSATRSRIRRASLMADSSRRWLDGRDRQPPWRDLGWLWAR